MLTPSNQPRCGDALPLVTTDKPLSDLTSPPLSPSRYLPKSDLSLSQIAEALLRERLGVRPCFSLEPVQTSDPAALHLSLVFPANPIHTWFRYAQDGDGTSYLGVQLSSSSSVDVIEIAPFSISRARICIDEIQLMAACLPYHHMAVRDLIKSYLEKKDPLLKKYCRHLDNFETPLPSLSHPTTLQMKYEEHCKLAWITSRYSSDDEEIAPDDIQEMRDIERILIARKDEVFTTLSPTERKYLNAAHLGVMQEVGNFYFSSTDHSPIIRALGKVVSELLVRASTWLGKSSTFDDTGLRRSLELAETPGFFNRFVSLYLVLSTARRR